MPSFLVGDDTGLIKRIELNWKFNEVVRQITDENEWYARKQQKLDEEVKREEDARKELKGEAVEAKKEEEKKTEEEDESNKAMDEFESFRAGLKLTSKFGKQEKYSGVRFG